MSKVKTVKGVGWDVCAIGNGLLFFTLLLKFWNVLLSAYKLWIWTFEHRDFSI